MIISGRLSVLVDNVKVGSMSDGEVFGEFAYSKSKRSATITSMTPTELIEIDKNGLDRIIESASADTKKMIIQLCEALSKERRVSKEVPFSESDLMSNLDLENELITKLAKQIFHRLDHSTSHVE